MFAVHQIIFKLKLNNKYELSAFRFRVRVHLNLMNYKMFVIPVLKNLK